MECYCGVDAVNKLAIEIDRLTRAKCEKDSKGNSILKYAGTGLGAVVAAEAAKKVLG